MQNNPLIESVRALAEAQKEKRTGNTRRGK